MTVFIAYVYQEYITGKFYKGSDTAPVGVGATAYELLEVIDWEEAARRSSQANGDGGGSVTLGISRWVVGSSKPVEDYSFTLVNAYFGARSKELKICKKEVKEWADKYVDRILESEEFVASALDNDTLDEILAR